VATAGTPQTATVKTAFATNLAATVTDAFGNPVAGVTVTFTAPASGASGTFAGGVNTATTNAQGVATAPVFTANTTAGSYTVTAKAGTVTTNPGFALTNLAGAPTSIKASSGTPQTATVNTAFAQQLAATVTDAFGNPVAGATVTFNAPASGASGTFAGGVNTAQTSSQGIATAPVFTANGTVGSYTVTAKTGTLTTSPGFALTNQAGG
jgi:protocatechuate 3,4-dioxygenase beta subunit